MKSGLRQREEVGPTEGPARAPAQVELRLVDWEQQETRLEQVGDGSGVMQA